MSRHSLAWPKPMQWKCVGSDLACRYAVMEISQDTETVINTLHIFEIVSIRNEVQRVQTNEDKIGMKLWTQRMADKASREKSEVG